MKDRQHEHGKIDTRHLGRKAYLYVRQSTLRQVLENTESTQRQYALKQRAIALGWPPDQVVVVDCDLGQSGASAADREGFQQLVAEVGMGRAGIVMGLEVSRLARNSTDWHRLLEICAVTDTLILDEDGIYDPAHFNDRLLLGLKGTMSEAELHLLRARLVGGILSKARRGELKMRLPIGFVYDSAGRTVLDPDEHVRDAIHLFFKTFGRTGSATATVVAFRKQGLLFPRRIWEGPNKGDVVWNKLSHARALWMLHNPRYAGAFVYGRTRHRKHAEVGRHKKLPRAEWTSLIRDAHPGYITWEDFERNEQVLRDNAAAHGDDRRRSPPREGPALLQGLVICGVCGLRMTVRYQSSNGRRVPIYICQREGIKNGEPACQRIIGTSIDKAIGKLVVDTVSPRTLEMTFALQQELDARVVEADALRLKHVERAQYEVDLARRRYMRVDPDNRLVADSLEAEWNARLRALVDAQEQYTRDREADHVFIDQEKRARILALAKDLPRLWNDPATPVRERKRMLRLTVEDVTLAKSTQITVHVRFRGGATQSLALPLPKCAWELRQTPEQLLREIGALLRYHGDQEVARILNSRGHQSGSGRPFSRRIVFDLRTRHGLGTRFDRLREEGMLTLSEMADKLGVCTATVKDWRHAGLLRAEPFDDRGQCLYATIGDDVPRKKQGSKLSRRVPSTKLSSQSTEEV